MGDGRTILEYRDRRDDQRRFLLFASPWIPGSIVAIVAPVAWKFRDPPNGWTTILVIPLFICGAWYIVARSCTARAQWTLRAIKATTGLVAFVIAVAYLGDPNQYLLEKAALYGWFSDEALLNRPGTALCLSVVGFGVADVIDVFLRVREWRERRAATTESTSDH